MTTRPARRLPRLFGGARRRLLLLLTLVGAVTATAAVATALLVRHLVDAFLHKPPHPPEAQLLQFAGLLALAAVVDGWMRRVERVRAEELGQRYVQDVRNLLFAHLGRIAPRDLQRLSRGGLLLRFLGDLTPLRQWLSLGVAHVLVVALVVPITLVVLAFLDWQICLSVTAVVAVGVWLSLRQGRALQATTRAARQRRAHLATNVSEQLAAAAVVQVHHQTRREGRRLAKQGRRLLQAMLARAAALGRLAATTRITFG